jgi:phage tail-like protein
MRGPFPVSMGLMLTGILSVSAFAQVPTRTSEPRLVVPTTATPVPSQPTVAPAPVAPTPAAAQPETTVTAVTAAPGNVTTLPTSSPATSSSTYAATAQSYSAGRFALVVDGATVGSVRSLEGGTAVADVVTESGTTGAPKKHLGGVKYEDISAAVGIDGKPVLDWIAQSWKGTSSRKNGSIVTMDLNYNPISGRQFSNALITETTTPAFDASSKETAQFTVKIAPEAISASTGSEAKTGLPLKQTIWQASTFRFEMAGLDGSKVARIDPFTVRQGVTSDAVGEQRVYEKTPGKIEFPNLKISLAASSAGTWAGWFDDFVVKGNNGDDKERNGAIVFLSGDLTKELGRINLLNCGIFRLAPDKLVVISETIRRVTAELYCERMELQTN